MAIFSEWEYNNRYTAGQTAIDRGEWRTAFPKYRSVFREIFRASGQIDHYNMMMRI